LGGGGYTRRSPLPTAMTIDLSTVVFDLVYRPRWTRLLGQAQRAGCKRLIGGWPMLIAQADASFAVWTGRQFPPAVRRHLLSDAEIV
jgi:shikimate 5-dehydrogenase